jgi:hypothetical protein
MILLLALLGSAHNSVGQDYFHYNLSVDNGLPSNHVYCYMYDRLGYLWLGTPSGVVKYNGYECKVFDQEAGLDYEDVWQLLEDRQGRIWLASIAGNIGYLKNDRYTRAYIANNHTTIRPNVLTLHGAGIAFVSPYLSGNFDNEICVERNDSFTRINLRNFFPSNLLHNQREHLSPFLSEEGLPYVVYRKILYKIDIDERLKPSRFTAVLSDTALVGSMGNDFLLTDNLLFTKSQIKGKSVSLYSLTQKKTIRLDFEDSVLDVVNGKKLLNLDHQVGIITKSKLTLYTVSNLDSSLRTLNIHAATANYVSIDRRQNIYLPNDKWGITRAGRDGLMLLTNEQLGYTRLQVNLGDAVFIGKDLRGYNYWLNESEGQVYVLIGERIIDKIKIKLPKSFRNFLVIDSSRIQFLYESVLEYNNVTHQLSVAKENLLQALKQSILVNDTTLVAIDAFCFSKSKVSRTKSGELHLRQHVIENDRFVGIAHDRLSNTVYAYSKAKLVLFDLGTGHSKVLEEQEIGHYGAKSIQSIEIDSFSNVFIKGDGHVALYDPPSNKYRYLFSGINLKDAQLVLYNGRIAVAGPFGLAAIKIFGKNIISEPYLIPNIKNQLFRNVVSCQLNDSNAILNTDNGSFSTRALFSEQNLGSYRHVIGNYTVVMQANGGYRGVNEGDTVILSNGSPLVQFDLINPYGNGRVNFFFRTDDTGTWQKLTSNQLVLNGYSSGNYKFFQLMATDNSLRTKPIKIWLYITPTWWEAAVQSPMFYIVLIGLIILVVIAIVYITKRIVVESNKRKNLRQDIELKSVYSQINPHFIFNSLNTSLYFIKKNRVEEAYQHVSKFSYLLRSYIASSRSKFISIADEIYNLETYIALQQERFENKFDFDFVVDEGLDVHSIKIPALLLQPIVENAIEHGLFHKVEKGYLRVSFKSVRRGFVQCIVEDNGIGRKKSKQISEKSLVKKESFGDALIKDLINIFNKYERIKISIEYTDKVEPETGTIVVLNIKYL